MFSDYINSYRIFFLRNNLVYFYLINCVFGNTIHGSFKKYFSIKNILK